jgi:excinuclease ABC subunit A
MDTESIVIRGAREHNLRNIQLDLPRNQLIVFTGVSGSGKSSLAFDTLYAEGQRRYVESLSSYARQFLGQLQKPDVDYLAGLSPSISIQQNTAGKNPRSAPSPKSTTTCVCSTRASARDIVRNVIGPSQPSRASKSSIAF